MLLSGGTESRRLEPSDGSCEGDVIRKSNGTGFYFTLSVSCSFVKTNLIGYMQISSGVTRQVRRPFRVKSLFLV